MAFKRSTKVLGTGSSPVLCAGWTLYSAIILDSGHQRPRILLLIPHLGGGGAENVFALLARGLSQQKYEVHLGLITGTNAATEKIPQHVTLHELGASRIRGSALRLLTLVRDIRPRLLISGMYHLNFLVLLLRPLFPRGTRVIVRQNGNASASLAEGRLPAYTRLFYRLLYRRADWVICQTAAMVDDLVKHFHLKQDHLIVLPNPLDVDSIRKAKSVSTHLWNGPGPHLLAVGRLSQEKGFDLLLRALPQVREHFPGTTLLIAGSGPEGNALTLLCRELSLESSVRFAGSIDNPWACFAGASAFVLSSRHEGLPNALLEAAASGLPLIALPAAGGVADLLRGQRGAWLATEISAEALALILIEALQTLGPADRFPHPFIEQFRVDRAIAAYERLMDAAVNGTAP